MVKVMCNVSRRHTSCLCISLHAWFFVHSEGTEPAVHLCSLIFVHALVSILIYCFLPNIRVNSPIPITQTPRNSYNLNTLLLYYVKETHYIYALIMGLHSLLNLPLFDSHIHLKKYITRCSLKKDTLLIPLLGRRWGQDVISFYPSLSFSFQMYVCVWPSLSIFVQNIWVEAVKINLSL